MRIDARHWTVAGMTALGLHAAVAVMLFRTPPHPAVSAGGGGVQVTLAPATGPSGAEAPTGPQQDAAEVTPSEIAGPTAPSVETPTRPDAELVELPTVEPEPEPMPRDAPVEPPVAEPIEPARLEPEPSPEVAEVPLPEPAPERPPEPQTVEAQDARPPPTPRARPVPPRRVVAQKPAPPRPVETAAPPPGGPVSAASETQGRTGQQASGGQPAQSTNAGAPNLQASAAGGIADYMSQLRAWLEQHKEYPNRARRRRIEGTALLVFVMDRSGNVLSHRVERSAGDPSLDTAVVEMIERAQPLPHFPDSFRQAQLEVRVPVQFMLR